MASSVEKEEVVSLELPAPLGWKKKAFYCESGGFDVEKLTLKKLMGISFSFGLMVGLAVGKLTLALVYLTWCLNERMQSLQRVERQLLKSDDVSFQEYTFFAS